MSELTVVELGDGIAVNAIVEPCVNWGSIRTLFESGVTDVDIAGHFKIEAANVRLRASREGWLRPRMVERLRRKVTKRQLDTFKRTGKAGDVAKLKSEIWEERGEKMKEKAYQITKAAFEGVSPEAAALLISDASDFQRMVEVARKLSGEEAKEKENGPSLAVNIGFLRTMKVEDAPAIDV